MKRTEVAALRADVAVAVAFLEHASRALDAGVPRVAMIALDAAVARAVAVAERVAGEDAQVTAPC